MKPMTKTKTKIGRNDPCPCGSGKKYKHCCRETTEAQARVPSPVQGAPDAPVHTPHRADTREDTAVWVESELDRASNAVIDQIRAGQLEEAEKAAYRLLKDYPEVIDGHERLAMVYEARSDQRKAAEHYRWALRIVDEHPGDYDPEIRAHYVNKLNTLDPSNNPPNPSTDVPR